MRKIVLFATVFSLAMSGSVMSQSASAKLARDSTSWSIKHSIDALTKQNGQDFDTVNQTIEDRLQELYKELQKMSQQIDTVGTANTGQILSGQTGQDTNRAVLGQQSQLAARAVSTLGKEDQMCVAASGTLSGTATDEAATNAAKVAMNEMMGLLNGSDPMTANGVKNFHRELFEQRKGLCSADGAGGADTTCAGAGDNDHLSLGTILNSDGWTEGSSIETGMNYFKKLMFVRVHEPLAPELMAEPDTDAMDLMIQSDRLKAEMSVGGTIFTKMEAYRKKFGGANALNSVNQRLEKSGFSVEKRAEIALNGISLHGLLKTLTVGSFTPEMMMQKFNTTTENAAGNILAEIALSNVIQFRQLELLEAIAVAQGVNVVTSRDPAFAKINAEIIAKNNGQ